MLKHDTSEHALTSVALPLQYLPPCSCPTHVLLRVITPDPHVTSHWPHSVHRVHTPSTVDTTGHVWLLLTSLTICTVIYRPSTVDTTGHVWLLLTSLTMCTVINRPSTVDTTGHVWLLLTSLTMCTVIYRPRFNGLRRLAICLELNRVRKWD